MERTAINPVAVVNLGVDQAELVEGRCRELICSRELPRWLAPGRLPVPGSQASDD
jgi:hypothetical protein